MTNLQSGIAGQESITQQMESLGADLQSNKVNELWKSKAYPSLKALSAWFLDLLERVSHCAEWTSNVSLLKSIWLSGLFNGKALLTSNLQVAARSNNLKLDDLQNRYRFYNTRDLADISDVPEYGMNIHGLFMEGACWVDGQGEEEGHITDGKNKELHAAVPICHVFAVCNLRASDIDWTAMYH